MKKTIDFLTQLDQNNNREWFQNHKEDYEQAHVEMIDFAHRLMLEMSEHDVLSATSGKRSLFRIYRDVRFGKDKTPYKTNWAGRFQRAGAERRGGYYYQIGPHGSFVMGGFFGPNAKDLLHIRKHLDQDGDFLREVIDSETFHSFFGAMQGNQLKTSPRGFEKESPNIDLIRYKQFLVRHDFTNDQVYDPGFASIMSHAFQMMRPFLDVMTEILTTDLNGVKTV